MKRREVTSAGIVLLLAAISALTTGCYVRDRGAVVVHDDPHRYDDHHYDHHEDHHDDHHNDHHDDHPH